MSEPDPIYTTVGEQLDPATVEVLVRHYESMRADGISIIRTAEKGLRDLGVHVQPGELPRAERRRRDRK